MGLADYLPNSFVSLALLEWHRHLGGVENSAKSSILDGSGRPLLRGLTDGGGQNLKISTKLCRTPQLTLNDFDGSLEPEGRTLPLNSSSSEKSLKTLTAVSSKIDSFSSPTGLWRHSSSRLNSSILDSVISQTEAVGSSNFPRNCLALTSRRWKASTETP